MPTRSPDRTAEIVDLWMKTGRLMRGRFMTAAKKEKINPLQIHATYIIQHRDGITMKELADQLCITSPSATSLVNRLVKMKWVSRVADKGNRKLVRLTVAPSGKKMLSETMHKQGTVMHDILSLLSKDDQTSFARVLTKLHSALSHSSK